MASELELKALVTDPGRLRAALAAAGGSRQFRGRMDDRRLDRHGALTDRDEVLRVRRWRPDPAGEPRAQVAWKSPRSISADGYKQREEIEFAASDALAVFRLFERLGYEITHGIDRFVEVWALAGASLRLEWYPRMDVLLEIEGAPAQIEEAISLLGLTRSACSSEPLATFVERYAVRTGREPLLVESGLDGETPGWANA